MPLVAFIFVTLFAAAAGAKEIAVLVQGGKSGAGHDEIRIFDDGRVRLSKTPMHDSPPQIKEGRIPAASAARLFDFVVSRGFLELDDEYPNDRQQSHWNSFLVTLTVGDKQKRVSVEQGTRPPGAQPLDSFYEVIGAVKLAAALALPEALKQRFLRWL